LGIIIGSLILYLKNKSFEVFYISQFFLSSIIIYYWGKSPVSLGLILLGTNLIAYAYHLKRKHSIDVSILNSVVLIGILLFSGIEKFRGFNKITPSDLKITIPIIILFYILIYFIIQFIKNLNSKIINTQKDYFLSAILLITTFFYYAINYLFYKEIGIATLFIPLVLGITASYINILLNFKDINKIVQVILMLIIPFSFSGLLGIGLAIFSFILMQKFMAKSLGYNDHGLTTAEIFIPILFLLTAAELRENEGQITRFNLVSGHVLGWILISAVIVSKAYDYLQKMKKILIENEIEKLIPISALLFTVLIATLMVKFGHNQSLASILVLSSIYLFIIDLIAPNKLKDKMAYIYHLGIFLGAFAFLVLIRI
jgi:hypothetical protein